MPFSKKLSVRHSAARFAKLAAVGLGAFIVTALPAKGELSLTVETAVAQARANHPELAAARNLIAEAQARTLTSGRLTNPELSTEIAGGQNFEGRLSISMTQRFPLTARLRLEHEISTIAVEIARLEVRERERQIAIATRAAFYELAVVQSAMAQARRQINLAETFAEMIAMGIPQGFGSQLDNQEAVLAADMLRAATEAMRSQEIAAAARLNTLLGRRADAPLAINESLRLPAEPPAPRPVGMRADLQLAELALRQGATEVTLAKSSRWDDVGVGILIDAERFADEPEGIEPESLIGIRLMVPLPFWQDGSGEVAEKEAAQLRQTQTLEALRFTIQNEALAAHAIMAARHRSAMAITSKLLPAAQQQVADAEVAYTRGELSIQEVFRKRENLIETESAALAARKNYFAAYSEWLGVLGQTPAQP